METQNFVPCSPGTTSPHPSPPLRGGEGDEYTRWDVNGIVTWIDESAGRIIHGGQISFLWLGVSECRLRNRAPPAFVAPPPAGAFP